MVRPLKLVTEKQLIGRRPGQDAAGRPLNAGPGFRRVAPARPIGLTPLAAQWWDDIVPGLVAADLLSPEHAPALEAAAECWSRWKVGNRIIKAEGVLDVDRLGTSRRHPVVAIVADAAKEYMGWCRLFGLTPCDEQRVGKPGGDAAQDLDNPFAHPS